MIEFIVGLNLGEFLALLILILAPLYIGLEIALHKYVAHSVKLVKRVKKWKIIIAEGSF